MRANHARAAPSPHPEEGARARLEGRGRDRSLMVRETPSVLITMRVSKCSSGALAKPEIAAASALHDGLAARQFEFVIEARHHCKVAIAMHVKAEIGQAQLLVELGIAATRHVEVEMAVGFIED